MEEIFSVIIPLLAIAGWLFGTFNKNEDEKGGKRAGKPVLQRNPTPTASGGVNEKADHADKQPGAVQQQTTASDSTKRANGTESREQTNREEYAEINQDNKVIARSGNRQSVNVNVEPSSDNGIRKSLTKKGLVNSVIMAEVLGEPRALKPYGRPNRVYKN